MSLFDGSPMMVVVALADGGFGVRAVGGNALGSVVETFATQNEADDWIQRRTLNATNGVGILKPGGGQAVA